MFPIGSSFNFAVHWTFKTPKGSPFLIFFWHSESFQNERSCKISMIFLHIWRIYSSEPWAGRQRGPLLVCSKYLGMTNSSSAIAEVDKQVGNAAVFFTSFQPFGFSICREKFYLNFPTVIVFTGKFFVFLGIFSWRGFCFRLDSFSGARESSKSRSSSIFICIDNNCHTTSTCTWRRC